ncbi:HNH endonuclease signature motif containing protein [Aeromicrobium sp.]|uniref:HNH endonuclease signature motif containing protein n=1 Tax=Aeromicrobium sp. TaxID=1871063 RepID=UPI002FC6C280
MAAVLDPGKLILDEITALEVERARIEAKIASKMLDFQDLRRRQAESNPNQTAAKLETSFAADELGAALHQPTRTVQCRLAQARRVRGRLMWTWQAFLAGRIDTYRISLIASAVDKLRGDNHAIIELDHRVTSYAPVHTAAQLKGWLKRFVAKNAPDQQAAKTEKAKRGVWLDHQDDGMSYLHAYIPTADAIVIDAELTEKAKTLPADGRTLDQKRADVFIARLRGHIEEQSSSSRAVIGITVPVTTLAGLTDEPGESFDGSFALPADMVRDLAQQPGTLFHRVFTDRLGRILDVTELGRFPSAKLKTAIDIRDGTCRFTTCTRAAMESDKDHEVPHPRGPTTGSNLRGLCRRHHNMKTYGVTEPTEHVMRDRAPSRAEHDLATFIANIEFAA